MILYKLRILENHMIKNLLLFLSMTIAVTTHLFMLKSLWVSFPIAFKKIGLPIAKGTGLSIEESRRALRSKIEKQK